METKSLLSPLHVRESLARHQRSTEVSALQAVLAVGCVVAIIVVAAVPWGFGAWYLATHVLR